MHREHTTGRLSDEARARFTALEGRPPFMSDWRDAVMLHYEVDPTVLKRDVPFDLDLYEGRAFVSLVAFEMIGLRPSRLPRLGRLLLSPMGTHAFLNVRTYVRVGDETGIYFLAEFLPNRLSVALGPITYGLPYRFGRLQYENNGDRAALWGTVEAGHKRRTLCYRAACDADVAYQPAAAGTLTEFLMERYTAFTRWHGIDRRFRIWHAPWQQQPITAQVLDESLLHTAGGWINAARLIGANYSPGVDNIWMGAPRLITRAASGARRERNEGRAPCPAS